MLGTELHTTYDGLDMASAVIATYFMRMSSSEDLLGRIKSIARMIYPGAWQEPHGATAAARETHSARILGVYETPPYELRVPAEAQQRQVIFQLAVPLLNVDTSIATLLTTVAGEILAFGDLKLLDLSLPPRFTERFAGPKFGVAGLRRLLNVEKRPLLLAIMKPSMGYTAETGANAFREAAIGGADVIKDEELLSDPPYCRRTDRIRLYMQAEKQAFEQTGEHTLYAVNITDQPHKLLENALQAVELGANALMLNYLQVGLDAARAVTDDPRITVPVLGHNSGATTMFASPYTGLSSTLVSAKLPRLCGVDMGIVLSGLGSFPGLPERCVLMAREMLSPLRRLAPTLPLIASGVTTDLIPTIVAQYGTEIGIGAGTTIFGYPEGAAAGARALRAAIDRATGDA